MIDIFPIEHEEFVGVAWGCAASALTLAFLVPGVLDPMLVALCGAWGGLLSIAGARRLVRARSRRPTLLTPE